VGEGESGRGREGESRRGREEGKRGEREKERTRVGIVLISYLKIVDC
jgi:hypothetical protein